MGSSISRFLDVYVSDIINIVLGRFLDLHFSAGIIGRLKHNSIFIYVVLFADFCIFVLWSCKFEQKLLVDLGIIQFSSILVVGGRIVGILIGFGKMSLSRGKNALPSRYL